ncbi:MAG: nucleotidyltransferase family protein [Rudaea sp.]
MRRWIAMDTAPNPSTEPHSCVVLLAAGAASRFGSAKQIADIDGIAMVRHCALNALRTGVPVVVVTGAHRERVEQELHELDVVPIEVVLIQNPTWQRGMGSSIACGVRAALDRFARLESIVIVLADQPAISAEHLLALMRRHAERSDSIVASRANDVLGPPIVFPRRLFEELMELHGQTGARHVVDRHRDALVAFDLPEAGIDIDSAADHATFRASQTPA